MWLIYRFVPVEPLVTLPINMFSFPEGGDVTIKCKVESSPQAVTTWRRVPREDQVGGEYVQLKSTWELGVEYNQLGVEGNHRWPAVGKQHSQDQLTKLHYLSMSVSICCGAWNNRHQFSFTKYQYIIWRR